MWWVITAIILGLLPFIIRWVIGNPLLPGTETYLFANWLHQLGFSSTLSISIILVTTLSILAGVIASLPRFFRTNKSLWQVSDATRLLLLLSPSWIASATVFPSHAFLLGILTGSLVLWKKNKLFGAALFAIFLAGVSLLFCLPSAPAGIIEFGVLNGYGLFGLIVAFLGGCVLWENKAKTYFIALGIAALIILSFFIPELVVIGATAVAIIGGIGVVRLLHRKWAFPLLRGPSILLCACGLLFSTLACISLISHVGPDGGTASDLAALQSAIPDGLVLTELSPEWVTWWGHAYTVTMPETIRTEIWQSRNIYRTRDILEAWNVTTILITPEMKASLWNDHEDGLLFLLHQSKTFKSLGQGKFVEAWVYDPPQQ